MKAVVLLSGGMDSATALAKATMQMGVEDILALSMAYGSTHQAKELLAAEQVSLWYNIPRRVVTFDPAIFKGGGSALLGEGEIPTEEYHDITKETPSATVVPFRNANFISAAVAIAEAHGFDQVWVAMHQTDFAGWAYPDCSPEFVGAMSAAIYVGTLHKVRLVTPFLWNTKAEIVATAAELEAPLQLTWSCYRGGEKHCGECPTCLERIKAFQIAGFVDPVEYLKSPDWGSQIPYPVPE